MERVLTQDERIRRAEEIYLRRRNLVMPENEYIKINQRTKPNKNSKINVKLFKKVFLQIVVSLLLYCIFYLIYDTNYPFSEKTLDITYNILNHDMEFNKIYMDINQYIQGFINKIKTEEDNNPSPDDNIESDGNEIDQEDDVLNNDNSSQDELNEEVVVEETQSVSAPASPLYSLIRPVIGGYVSSEFGERESTSPIVSTNHKGIDIALATRQ